MSIAFFPDDGRLVSAGYDKMIRIWDGSTGSQIAMLSGHESRVYAVVVSPSGEWIVSGGADGIIVWNAVTRSAHRRIRHLKQASSIAFRPDGRQFAASDADGVIHLLEPMAGSIQNRLVTSRAAELSHARPGDLWQ